MFAIDIGEWDSNYLNEKRHFSPPSGTSCSQVVHQWRSFFFFPVKGPFFCFFFDYMAVRYLIKFLLFYDIVYDLTVGITTLRFFFS